MSNEKDWIDFDLVKESVSMEMLIIHFGLLLKFSKSLSK